MRKQIITQAAAERSKRKDFEEKNSPKKAKQKERKNPIKKKVIKKKKFNCYYNSDFETD